LIFKKTDIMSSKNKRNYSDPISETQTKLNNLKVKRSVDKTDKFDIEIKELENIINWFNYGIRSN